ncbi:MAG TPA: methyltransferase domain-containing protein [Xanthomonadaceae bacterium]|jgi:SAM-dependent methyltransferase
MNAPPDPQERARQPHAVLDLETRRFKGMKIERLLDLPSRAQPMRMLEIGTGSGGIAHYFGTHPKLRIAVDAVDVVDNRLVCDGYAFQLVKDTTLPYEDRSFDVVLSNHVIEHVGDRDAQLRHLREIGRVLREDGVGYLAVPNRWMLVEPHYRLAFLSWWPHGWRSAWLKRFRGVDFYDCEPLQLGQLERLFDAAGFRYRNLCVESLRATLAIEQPRSLARKLADLVPAPFIGSLRRIIPTLIYRFGR